MLRRRGERTRLNAALERLPTPFGACIENLSFHTQRTICNGVHLPLQVSSDPANSMSVIG